MHTLFTTKFIRLDYKSVLPHLLFMRKLISCCNNKVPLSPFIMQNGKNLKIGSGYFGGFCYFSCHYSESLDKK